MKILQVNKFFFPYGGSESYMFSLSDLLRRSGHQVIPFSMKDPRNFATEYTKYFVKNIDFNKPKENIAQKCYLAVRAIYSIEARAKITQLLNEEGPHLAHTHNFSYHMTPSILFPLSERGIPVIQTLHDYHIICPSHNLYDVHRMEVCEDCQGKSFLRAIKRGCVKGSRLKTFIGAVEGYIAAFLKTYSSRITLFISPSKFLRNKVIEYGVDPRRVIHIPNFLDLKQYNPKFEGSDYFVYFGRLEEFKGIRTMFQAISNVKEAKLYVLGDGSIGASLEEMVAEGRLNRIHMLGFKHGEELREIVRNSLCTICPSEWFENNPISVLESFALGKPVLGASIGGIPELIEEGVNGLLFKPGNAEELSEKIDYCLRHKSNLRAMGIEARKRVEERHSPVAHYRKILEKYLEVLR